MGVGTGDGNPGRNAGAARRGAQEWKTPARSRAGSLSPQQDHRGPLPRARWQVRSCLSGPGSAPRGRAPLWRRAQRPGDAGKAEAAAASAPLTSGAHGVAPAGDEALGAGGRAGAGQGDGGHPAADDRRRGQLDQHDVIVQGLAVVAGVADDLGGVDELLAALLLLDVVLSQPHLDAAGGRGARGGLFSASCAPSPGSRLPAPGGGVATAQGRRGAGVGQCGSDPGNLSASQVGGSGAGRWLPHLLFLATFPIPPTLRCHVSRAPKSNLMPRRHPRPL